MLRPLKKPQHYYETIGAWTLFCYYRDYCLRRLHLKEGSTTSRCKEENNGNQSCHLSKSGLLRIQGRCLCLFLANHNHIPTYFVYECSAACFLCLHSSKLTELFHSKRLCSVQYRSELNLLSLVFRLGEECPEGRCV